MFAWRRLYSSEATSFKGQLLIERKTITRGLCTSPKHKCTAYLQVRSSHASYDKESYGKDFSKSNGSNKTTDTNSRCSSIKTPANNSSQPNVHEHQNNNRLTMSQVLLNSWPHRKPHELQQRTTTTKTPHNHDGTTSQLRTCIPTTNSTPNCTSRMRPNPPSAFPNSCRKPKTITEQKKQTKNASIPFHHMPKLCMMQTAADSKMTKLK